MLKAAGLLFIFSCAALLGTAQARNLSQKERQLAQILEFTRQLTVYLKTSMAPPRELIHRIAHQSALESCPLVQELDQNFSESNDFRRNMNKAMATVGLSGTPAGEILSSLGDEIGVKPLESQLSALSSAIVALERELETARAKTAQYAPLYRRLGVLGGLLAVVLLV